MSEGSKQTKLTLCICFYNAENFLNRCIDSFKDYLVDEVEVVLIDDGSSDNSVAIVKEYMDIYKQIKLFRHQQNKGISNARKTSVDKAKSEFIMFLDADDEFIENPFEFFLDTIKTHNVDIIEYMSIFDTEDNSVKIKKIKNRLLPGNKYLESFFKSKYQHVMLWLRMIRKSLFYPITFSDNERIHDDNLAWLIILSRAKTIYISSKPLLKINQNPNSLTRAIAYKDQKTNLTKKMESMSEFYLRWIDHLEIVLGEKHKNIYYYIFKNRLLLYFAFYSSIMKFDEFRILFNQRLASDGTTQFMRLSTVYNYKFILKILLFTFGLKFTGYVIYYFSKVNLFFDTKFKNII